MNYLLFVTKKGLVKKTAVEEYSRIRASGLVAIRLDRDDQLLATMATSGQDDVFLATQEGKSIRFSEADLRPTGRATRGVIGVRTKANSAVVATTAIPTKTKEKQTQALVVTQNGFGKRTFLSEYKRQGRGGQGIYTARVTQKTGPVVDVQIIPAKCTDDLLIISAKGQVIRLPIKQISILSRQTQGVKLINLDKDDTVASLTVLGSS